jgi:hypothetical protein
MRVTECDFKLKLDAYLKQVHIRNYFKGAAMTRPTIIRSDTTTSKSISVFDTAYIYAEVARHLHLFRDSPMAAMCSKCRKKAAANPVEKGKI